MTTDAMTDRDRYHACMSYQPVDRAPFWDWGGWPETIERWRTEGYDPETSDPARIADSRITPGNWFFPNPPFEHTIVEETDVDVVFINHEGILMKERRDNPRSSMPQFLKFPVETRAEFREFWAQRMIPDHAARIGPDWQTQLTQWRAQPVPLQIIADRWGGFFGPQRNLTGLERLCMLFYDDPAFIEEMMDANADFIIAMMGPILDVIDIDAFVFWEDMAFNHGPLLDPALARQFMLPRYRRVTDFLYSRGVEWIGLDSDGQIDTLIPIWVDAGINALYPFEVQAGMDVLQVRRQFGKSLRLWGGVDKRALIQGPDAIDTELNRLRPLIEEGGYVPHLDHGCPPDIAFSNYCYFLQRLHDVCAGK